MDNLRKYGKPPYTVAVIHGGPGAAGEMMPVARELSETRGVLEPLQTKMSINEQVAELKFVITEPVVLIGHSWGAWLSFIFAAKHPELVKKLILISSAPFESKYVDVIMKIRKERLTEKERDLLNTDDLNVLGRLILKTDSFSPIPDDTKIDLLPEIYEKIWPEANRLRKSGKLLELGRKIKCPVTAIHGDYDPHPYLGVKEPLTEILSDFRFILLKDCGHIPWLEKEAKDAFYGILKRAIS